MISVDEAERIIQQAVPLRPVVAVPLVEAIHRVLREPIVADRDYPPYDRVMMDGIALVASSCTARRRSFTVETTAFAGAARTRLLDPLQNCVEAMTGAVLPEGSDAIVPIEDLAIAGGMATVREGIAVEAGQFVHRMGSDRRRGDILLEPGRILAAAQIAVLASTGRARVAVAAPPIVTVVSTGDEIVDVGQDIEPHQIRPSNAYGMAAALTSIGCETHTVIVPDDPGEMTARLAQAMSESDVLILSGGVSAGAADHVPAVLEALQVGRLFHKVTQRPGKPMWFGMAPGGKPVFALPGNPVSSMVCFRRYVLPAILGSMGYTTAGETAVAATAMEGDRVLTRFLPVAVSSREDGRVMADPGRYSGSGDLAALAGSDGFVEIPAGVTRVQAGECVRLHRWRA